MSHFQLYDYPRTWAAGITGEVNGLTRPYCLGFASDRLLLWPVLSRPSAGGLILHRLYQSTKATWTLWSPEGPSFLAPVQAPRYTCLTLSLLGPCV